MPESRRLTRSRSPHALGASLAAPRSRILEVRTFGDRIALIQHQIAKTFTDRGIRRLALQLVTQRCQPANTRTGEGGWCIPERDRWAEAVVVFNFIRANVRYTSDTYGLDTYQTGRRTLEVRAGDCDDFTILLAGMLLAIGHPMRLKSIELTGQEAAGFSHIYAQALIHGQWRSLDASTSNLAGWEVPASRIAEDRIDAALPPGQLTERRR